MAWPTVCIAADPLSGAAGAWRASRRSSPRALRAHGRDGIPRAAKFRWSPWQPARRQSRGLHPPDDPVDEEPRRHHLAGWVRSVRRHRGLPPPVARHWRKAVAAALLAALLAATERSPTAGGATRCPPKHDGRWFYWTASAQIVRENPLGSAVELPGRLPGARGRRRRRRSRTPTLVAHALTQFGLAGGLPTSRSWPYCLSTWFGREIGTVTISRAEIVTVPIFLQPWHLWAVDGSHALAAITAALGAAVLLSRAIFATWRTTRTGPGGGVWPPWCCRVPWRHRSGRPGGRAAILSTLAPSLAGRGGRGVPPAQPGRVQLWMPGVALAFWTTPGWD